MGVKFFGQFLIERGEIQAAELRTALAERGLVDTP